MKKWAPNAPPIETAEMGFSDVINTTKALQALPASEVNSEALLTWFQAARNQPSFLQSPYSCARQYPSSPSLCRGGIQMVKYDNGAFTLASEEWFDGMQYYPQSAS
jgi:hypothetical protein